MGMKSLQAFLEASSFRGTDFRSACSPAGAFNARGTQCLAASPRLGRCICEASPKPRAGPRAPSVRSELSEALAWSLGADLPRLPHSMVDRIGLPAGEAAGNNCDEPELASDDLNSVTGRPPKLAPPAVGRCTSVGRAALPACVFGVLACDDARRLPSSAPARSCPIFSSLRSRAKNLPSISKGPRRMAVMRTPAKCTSSLSPRVEL
mmetsp:Transcript_125167/g.350485  ORF Transcript_125167/g.350485 Transcript_125167/m.350485 type:complete len:207 (+) Transcript_125167:159-779(+)